MAGKFKLNYKQKNWLLSAHVLFVIAWFGGILCMFALVITALTANDSNELYVTLLNINLLDDLFVKYPALGTLITGFLLAVLTNWGITRYYWIIVKEILTLGTIGFGIFYMNRWLDKVTAVSSSDSLNALQLPELKFLVIGNLVNLFALATMVSISYLKPWGKTKTKKRPGSPPTPKKELTPHG